MTEDEPWIRRTPTDARRRGGDDELLPDVGSHAQPNWPRHGETPITPRWRFVSIGFEGDPVDIGGGLNPWTVTWRSTREWIVVSHPQYPQERHSMSVYEVEGSEPPVTFAAGEYSNGVWGFYVPDGA